MYKRFLNNEDYKAIVTREALNQLTRNDDSVLEKAEEAAEASIVEYLTDNYEVEKELMKGKMLLPYNSKITYPVGSHFYYEGEICQALRSINGIKEPTDKIYWVELPEYDEQKVAKAKPYSQALTWNPGDIAIFSEVYYECVEYNGLDFNDIRIPGINAWAKVESYKWEPNVPYNEWDTVSYDGKFYALVSKEGINLTDNPDISDNWGLIGDYDPNYAYEFSETEYVVYNGSVRYPIMNPTADKLELGFNIKHDDPRNTNIKKHMLRMSVYELHKLVSPNNVSSVRISDYEASIIWLRDANRCRINPGIPRKLDEEGEHVTEFAIATFMRDYDPNKNPWQI